MYAVANQLVNRLVSWDQEVEDFNLALKDGIEGGFLQYWQWISSVTYQMITVRPTDLPSFLATQRL